MKKINISYVFASLAASLIFLLSAANASAQNSVTGMVFDINRKPVADIDIELLDEYERLIRSTKTNGSGLYVFQSLRSGVYYVQTRIGGTKYRETKERFQLGFGNRASATGVTGIESLQVNLRLEADSRRNAENTLTANEVIFAQDIPPEAEKAYIIALKSLDKKDRIEAISAFETAIGIFPEYYLALDALGNEYLLQRRYSEAEKVLQKALRVNARSFSSAYNLAAAQYQLEKRTEAITTLEKTIVINPLSVNSFFLLGKIRRELKDFKNAEKNFQKANELSKEKLSDIHWELALLYYYNLKQYENAAKELEDYLKTNPKANKEQISKLIKEIREKAKQK